MLLTSPSRHRFSVDDYEQMLAFGILSEADHVELIRGEIVDKMPKGSRHSRCVNRLIRHLLAVVGSRWLVSSQNPVRLEDSEPEPDGMLLCPRADEYETANPEATDVAIIIEVADSSLGADRTSKLALYAEAGIAEYWIVNLIDECIEVHRQPKSDGTYVERQILSAGETIHSVLATDLVFRVDEIL